MTHVYTRNDGMPTYPWLHTFLITVGYFSLLDVCRVLGSRSSSLGAKQHNLLNILNDEKPMLSLCKPLQGKLNIYH
jgi:hypothetical protein